MDTAALVGMTLAVAAGAASQRLTGLGFALVAAPFLVLLLGPFQGVLLANLLSLVSNLMVLSTTWREIDWRRLLQLAVPAVVLVAPGAWVARTLPGPVLLTVVGGLALASLLSVGLLRRLAVLRGPFGAAAAGAVSGFMNVTAGVGGPALAVYALSSRWAQASFVATAQPYFALVNGASLAAKGLPTVAGPVLLTAIAALAVGAGIGQLGIRRVPAAVARRGTAVLAVAGALATLAKGLSAL